MTACKNCACDCEILPITGIQELSEIPKGVDIKNNYIRNATDDIDDLIGSVCAEQLCKALEQAVKDLQDAGTGELKDYLASKWINIIQHGQFQRWYAYRVNWHWLEGSSITELKSVGLIKSQNTDEEYKNGFEHASETQRKRLQDSAGFYAEKAKTKFLERYWSCNAQLYDCVDNCCANGCKGSCTCGQNHTGEAIGLTII